MVTKAQARRRKLRVKRKGTKPEKQAHAYLQSICVKHKMHPKMDDPKVHGHPDIWLTGTKTFILVNGCFWHACPKCPSNKKMTKLWKGKCANNAARDKRQIAALNASGWDVVVIWEHDFKNGNYRKVIDNAVNNAKKGPESTERHKCKSKCWKTFNYGKNGNGDTCCCNCSNHVSVYSHPWVNDKPVSHLSGWICLLDGVGATLANKHGLCEMHEKGVSKFDRSKGNCCCESCRIDAMQQDFD